MAIYQRLWRRAGGPAEMIGEVLQAVLRDMRVLTVIEALDYTVRVVRQMRMGETLFWADSCKHR